MEKENIISDKKELISIHLTYVFKSHNRRLKLTVYDIIDKDGKIIQSDIVAVVIKRLLDFKKREIISNSLELTYESFVLMNGAINYFLNDEVILKEFEKTILNFKSDKNKKVNIVKYSPKFQ